MLSTESLRPFVPPIVDGVPVLALRPRDAAAAIGLSERAVQSLITDPSSGFPCKRVGRAVLVPLRELSDWLGAQSDHNEADE